MNAKLETIQITVKKPVAEILLNRPEKRNALNPQMVRELHNTLDAWKNDDSIRVIVLKGAGKAFCSGADLAYLKELRSFDLQKNVEDSMLLGNLFLKIYEFPKPVIAVVQGAALAGGCGLASVCDFVLATPRAKFGYPEVKIGFVAAMVSGFLIRQVGERLARELLLTGKILTAEEAKSIGLISEVIPEEKIDQAVEELTAQLVKNGPTAMATTKQLFADFTFEKPVNDIRRLAELNAQFRQTSEFLEGVSSFLEKREPNWQSTTKREEGTC